MTRHFFAALLGCVLAMSVARADQYPSRPITLIVPWTAGGITDSVSRVVADELRSLLGQPIIVENRPGAGGKIGSTAVARAAPDGYTIVLATFSSHVLPVVSKAAPPYDPTRDFDPLIQLNSTSGGLVVTPALPFKTVHDLITYAKANPGRLNYASIGIGSSPHLNAEIFKLMTGVDIVHVPYKGESQVITDLMSGQVQMYFMVAPKPYAESGQLRILGLTTKERSAVLPNWPTLHESGLPEFDRPGWQALMVPAKTPRAIVDKLNADINTVLSRPHVREKFISLGVSAMGGTPEMFLALLHKDIQQIKELTARLKIELN